MYLGIMEQAYSYQIQNLETKFIFALIIQSDTISNTKSQLYYEASVFLPRLCLMDPREIFNITYLCIETRERQSTGESTVWQKRVNFLI